MKINHETILVVDDAVDTAEMIRRNLEFVGYKAYKASSAGEAFELLDKLSFDLVITDMKMPRISGLELVKYIRSNFRHIGIMMVTGYATIEGAVNAVQHGVDNYLAKPFTDEELISSVREILNKIRQQKLLDPTSKQTTSISQFGIIGNSKPMQNVYDIINKASSNAVTVLISGESGTGKELVARAIHYDGNRASAPFVPVNCAAIPEELMGSELFGHLKGAFTGAQNKREGFFQTADKGSIFLDEISEMSAGMQAKLLRVMQEKEVIMLGSRQTIKVDIRIIAATNKDLHKMVQHELFREDLFYRLNVLHIHIPPLRERDDDIFLLIDHFLNKISHDLGKKTPSFSPNALRSLTSYRWPGNVRELENLLQRLIVMTDTDVIRRVDLPAYLHSYEKIAPDCTKKLTDVETDHIRNVLNLTKGNKTKAAEILGIDRKTLRKKLQS